MTTTPTSITIAVAEPVFTNPERFALAGFLAGYSGLTREAYALDLRQFTIWCQQHQLRLFRAHRADIECFARDLEAKGRARATVTRRLCTIAGFYKYAVEKSCSTTPRPRRSAARAWTTSRTAPAWTATNWARCWSPPGWSAISGRPGAPGRPARSAGRPARRPGSVHGAGHAARIRRRSSCRWPRMPPAAAW